MEKKTISILFARNNELWWDGLEKLLSAIDQFEVAGICASGIETMKVAAAIKPDIILLDEELSECDYVEVAQNMNKLSPETGIIVVTKPYKNIDINLIFKTRAKGYLDKDITLEELVRAIGNVARGGMVAISPLVAERMLQQLDRAEAVSRKETRHEFDISLSKREKEILTLLATKGTTNREIAEALCITENTVKSHLANIMWKMNVRNRQQAAALARESGMIV